MIILDENKRFSDSCLWNLQREAYALFGPKAWSQKGVPFYITSNPFIAKQYALVALGFIRDIQKEIDTTQPVYLFDLGAGSGRFAYLFLKEFIKGVKRLKLDKVPFKYVMTDLVDENMLFWREHSKLKTFFDQKLIDIAYYDHASDEDLYLKINEIVVKPGFFKNPPFLIGNYFFDTIPQDLFRVKEGVLEEGRVSIQSEGKSEDLNDPVHIESVQCHYHYQRIPSDKTYYSEDLVLEKILRDYSKAFTNATFLLPIGAFRVLNYFAKRSNSKYFLMVGDQGVTKDAHISLGKEPKISKHSTFSIPVCYHAISSYFTQQGGLGLLSSGIQSTFVVALGVLGIDLKSLTETSWAFESHLDNFEPQNYWSLINHVEKDLSAISLEHMLLLLKFGNWDPSNFFLFFEEMRPKVPMASKEIKYELLESLEKIYDSLYVVSDEEALVILNMGVLCVEMKCFQEAIQYFQRTLEVDSENAQAYFNMAVCYSFEGEVKKARDGFKRAKEINPDFSLEKIGK